MRWSAFGDPKSPWGKPMVRTLLLLLVLSVLEVTGGRAAQAQETYKFMVPPWQRGQEIDDIRRLYRPMLDYLSARIGAQIVLVSARSYEDAIDYLATGRVDFATMSPVPYVKAQAMNPGVHMLVTELSWTEDHSARHDSYLGMLITLKSRADIKTLQDLKGKSFAFVNRDSSSGFVFPTAVLARNQIDYSTFFSKFDFLGSHPRVTDAVAAGSVDAGATWDYNLAQATAKHGNIFKVISDVAIPNLGIAIHPHLPAEVAAKIKEALLTIDTTLLVGLPTAGYVERPESFYDIVRTVVEMNIH